VRACLYDPDVSEVYAALGQHWGFVPLPSRQRHPEENGIAERSGGYVKSNALKGRRFDSLEALAKYLERWNRTVAQVRIHGTTRQQVLRHFLEVDQPALQPVPGEPFGLFQIGTRTVHPDGHVEVDGAFYSVPHTLVGEQVRAQWDGHLVRVYGVGADLVVPVLKFRGPELVEVGGRITIHFGIGQDEGLSFIDESAVRWHLTLSQPR
jgi:hypothetical protein